MKMKLKPLAVAAMAVALSAQTSHAQAVEEETKPEFADLTVEEVQAAIKDGKVTVIDANSVKSYNAGHVPGAQHFATVQKSGLSKVLPEDKAALIVVYCGGPECQLWEKAAVAVKKLGYTNIKTMKAGISGWKAAKAEMELGDLKPPI